MKLKNMTNEIQFINFIDGSCQKILANDFVDIDENKIYLEERARFLKFFKIIPEIKTETIEKKYKSKIFSDGGTE